MTNKKLNYPAIAKEMAILTVAVAIIAAAVYFFLVPSHTSVSSISGLGIVLSNFVPLPLSAITMVLNIVLLIIGFFTCGREFGAKTVYTSVMLPVFLGLFERLFPDFGSMTDSQELDVLCYILVVSVGLSILFNRNASSGGLDIVAKIMNKYLHMERGVDTINLIDDFQDGNWWHTSKDNIGILGEKSFQQTEIGRASCRERV